MLELCNSVITYRSRYLTVLQPAPVLDLVLADEGNPRGLAFQLEAMWHHLTNVAGHSEGGLATDAAALLADTGVLVRRVADAADQAARGHAAAGRAARDRGRDRCAVGPADAPVLRAAAGGADRRHGRRGPNAARGGVRHGVAR